MQYCIVVVKDQTEITYPDHKGFKQPQLRCLYGKFKSIYSSLTIVRRRQKLLIRTTDWDKTKMPMSRFMLNWSFVLTMSSKLPIHRFSNLRVNGKVWIEIIGLNKGQHWYIYRRMGLNARNLLICFPTFLFSEFYELSVFKIQICHHHSQSINHFLNKMLSQSTN